MIYLINSAFHAAHMLTQHEGACRNLHGHTYNVQVALEVPDSDVFQTNRNMAVDFSELKGVVDAAVRQFDHALIGPPEVIKGLLGEDETRKVLVTKGDPTVEEIARIMHKQIGFFLAQASINLGILITFRAIQIFETEKQGVRYEPQSE